MKALLWALDIILGIGSIIYAWISYRFSFNPLHAFPGPLQDRKLAFSAGAIVVLIGFILSWWIGRYHEIISLFGAWGMLLGASYWFNLRYFRKEMAPGEWRIIRITLIAGLIVALLSTGWFYLPAKPAPGTLLVGIALLLLSLRMWWRVLPQ
jgi:hypothetical protein